MIEVTSTGNDDTALLQEATNDAGLDPMRPQAMRWIGEFCITSQLDLVPNNVSLEGEGGGIEYRSSGTYAESFKGITRVYYDGPDTQIGYMLRLGDGTLYTRGHVVKNIVFDCAGKCNGVRMDRCSNSRFEGVSLARPYSGFVTLESCYGLTWRDCDVYDAALVFMDLRQEAHTADIENCAFVNMSTVNGGTSAPLAVIRIGKGGTHSSNVTIRGCNFDVYRVPYFLDALDALSLSLHGVYMEGRDAIMVNCIKLGDAQNVDRAVLGAMISGCRMTLPSGGLAAIGAQRVGGLVVQSGRVSGFDQVVNINHATCSGIAVQAVSKPDDCINGNPGPALVTDI
jgi:hypothetical protein